MPMFVAEVLFVLAAVVMPATAVLGAAVVLIARAFPTAPKVRTPVRGPG